MKTRTDDPHRDDDSIESQAAAWLMEEESGLSPELAEEFQRWLAEDPRHAAAVAQLRLAWSEMLRLRNYRPGAQLHPDPELLAPAPRRRASPALVFAAAAALAVAAVAWTTSDRFRGLFRDDGVRYVTEAGGFNRTALPDGSVLTLNADSEARVKFSGQQRLVLLLRGEGHFVVASERDRPFVVEANGLHVRAVGTEFNVRTARSAVEVLVTHGRVKLTAAAARNLRADAPTLDAGQRAVLADPHALPTERALPVTIENVSLDEVRTSLAWQSPQLHFVNATLADAVRQFNQRSPFQIVLADPELGSIPVGGSFRPENVEAFVRLLESANEVTVERPDATRIVLRRAVKR
jgi:transmembrane sensor